MQWICSKRTVYTVVYIYIRIVKEQSGNHWTLKFVGQVQVVRLVAFGRFVAEFQDKLQGCQAGWSLETDHPIQNDELSHARTATSYATTSFPKVHWFMSLNLAPFQTIPLMKLLSFGMKKSIGFLRCCLYMFLHFWNHDFFSAHLHILKPINWKGVLFYTTRVYTYNTYIYIYIHIYIIIYIYRFTGVVIHVYIQHIFNTSQPSFTTTWGLKRQMMKLIHLIQVGDFGYA